MCYFCDNLTEEEMAKIENEVFTEAAEERAKEWLRERLDKK